MRSPVSGRASGECNAIKSCGFGDSELTLACTVETSRFLGSVWIADHLGVAPFHDRSMISLLRIGTFRIVRGFTEIWNKNTGKRIYAIAKDEDFASKYPEGRQLYVRHRKLERNSKLAKAVRAKRLKKTGDLCCDVSRFSFKRRHGSSGAGFIEAHHTVPISQFKGENITHVADIALVCSNRHRMLHKGNPLLRIAALRKRLRK
jgi:hypothetical protein